MDRYRTEEAKGFPNVILLDNLNACNLKCSMCDHKNMTRKVQKMDGKLYLSIINQIAQHNKNARVWLIFFGEPCLMKDMSGRISYAKNCGLTDVVLNSNGVLLKPKISRDYIECGLDALYVGIDAATKETYDKIRVGGDFDKAVSNVLHYRDLLRERGTKQKLFVQFVEAEENRHEIDAFVNFWTKEEVSVKVRPRVSWAGLIENGVEQEDDRKPCYWAMQTLNLCSDGRVAMCSCDVHCRVPFGDANYQTLEHIWKVQMADFRHNHKTGNWGMLPKVCRHCTDWKGAYAEYR